MGLPILEQKQQDAAAHQMPATGMPHDQEKAMVKRNLASVKRRVAIHSGKGGVGKTFLSINVAFVLSEAGYSVGLFDMDIDCPNVAKFLNLRALQLRGTPEGRIQPLEYKGLKVISTHFLTDDPLAPMIVRGPIKHKVLSELLTQVEWGELDILVYDLPPGTADVPMSSMLIGNLDGMLIVTTPQKEAIMDARKSALMAKDLGVPIIGIIENMSGEAFGAGTARVLADEMDIPYLGSVPLSKEIRLRNESGKPSLTLPGHEDIASSIASATMGTLEETAFEKKKSFWKSVISWTRT